MMLMDNKLECKICSKKVSKNNSYIGSHVKRVHNISLENYVEKFYKNLNDRFKIEKCGFCDNDAEYKLEIDHDDFTYKKYYEGYLCNSVECKNNISLSILGIPYNKKKFEHIGSKSEYLSKKYKISINEAKNMKYTKREIQDRDKSDLNGFILRHGDIEGRKKYKDRCNKIGRSNKKEWYIEKYGLEKGEEKWSKYILSINCSLKYFIERHGDIEGRKKYKDRCNKIGRSNKKEWYIEKYGLEKGEEKWKQYTDKLKVCLGSKISKSSSKIGEYLDNLGIIYETEYKISDINKYCDYYIEEYNTIIEFYGDYWHCNPKIYEKDYYHDYIKKTAFEIWKGDDDRINKIYDYFKKKVTIIIIWESTMIGVEYLYKLMNDNKDKNIIISI